MTIITTIVAVTLAVLAFRNLRVTRAARRPSLGWMSERWLADHRSSHSA